MRTKTVLGAVAVLAFASAGRAAEPPDLVAAYAAQLAAVCGPASAEVAAGLVQRVDLTGDGVAEWIIDAGRYPCPTRPAVFANQGRQVTIFTKGLAGRPLPAFQRVAYEAHLEKGAGGATSLWLTMGGSDCGGEDPAARCERQVVWLATARRLELAPARTAATARASPSTGKP